MEKDVDIVESLMRTAGRRDEPPEDAYRQVLVAATAAFREKTARRHERLWLFWAGAAAVLTLALALMFQWTPPGAEREALARVDRVVGSVELATGDVWRPLGESGPAFTSGMKLRTLAGGRAALALAGGASLRLAAGTEVVFDAPGQLFLQRGTIYIDSDARAGARGVEIVTPAGTARDLGTQFELRVRGQALRLRVREGSVSIDRGGQAVTGAAGDEVSIDLLGGVQRGSIATDSPDWQWAESIAPTPDIDGKPAATLIAWVARETGRRLRYESPVVEQRASTVILHGNIRHLAPLAALETMLATTDLEYVLDGDTMEIRARNERPPQP